MNEHDVINRTNKICICGHSYERHLAASPHQCLVCDCGTFIQGGHISTIDDYPWMKIEGCDRLRVQCPGCPAGHSFEINQMRNWVNDKGHKRYGPFLFYGRWERYQVEDVGVKFLTKEGLSPWACTVPIYGSK